MHFQFDTALLDKFPHLPGVYIMKNRGEAVIYVGKAKDLKQRVKQYFVPGRDGRTMVPFLVGQVFKIETIVVRSEKEALLLENTLIKQHKPKFNALLKDDKTYIAIRINYRHAWPDLQVVRIKGKPLDDALYFGPYTSAYAARNTVDLLQRLFPLRQCSDAEFARRNRPCILYGLKRCIAPCVGRCSVEEYRTFVDKTISFLKGHNKEIARELEKAMIKSAEALDFEAAAAYQRTLLQIEATIQQQHVDMPQGGDADLIGIYREADEVVLCQMFVRGGKLIGSKMYPFSNTVQEDSEIIESFLLQHYDAEIAPAKEILLAEPLGEAAIIADILTNLHGYKVDVYQPQRGAKKSLAELAKINAHNAFKQEKDAAALKEKILLSLKETLRLQHYPKRIECFDNSHLSGSQLVSVLVAYTNGFKDSSRYRTYKSKDVVGADDYGAMKEVLLRRYKKAKEEDDLPDLVIIDGGKGHLNVALRVFEELNIISVEVIGIAKDDSRHDKGGTQEQIFLPNIKDPVLLKKNSPLLFLLQEIRDEAHRFAINFQKKQRSKKLVKSTLDDIEGIGPVKKKALLLHFGSVKAIKAAALQDLAAVSGISDVIAKQVYDFFRTND
ncbi:MAG: excinuclease ABC subunit UvrC [Parachlamydiales bacterium]|jgi:excinuclease ABC subunit C